MEVPKSIRRSTRAVDKDILNALKEQVEEFGFMNITLNGVLAKAAIEPIMFYKRYPNLNALLDNFIQSYDFWLTNIAKPNKAKNLEEYSKAILTNLANALYDNKIMQKLLLWELAENNHITCRTAQKREDDYKMLLESLDSHFHNHGISHAKGIAAILIGGIYYLILHKDHSTFCDIDFSSKVGKQELFESIRTLTTLVFNLTNTEQKNIGEVTILANSKANKMAVQKTTDILLEKAILMKADGLSLEQIVRYTGLPVCTVETL